jgi:23S rRNA pseudouridine2457 synthase
MLASLLSFSPVVPLIILNKPFRVLCQFRDDEGRPTLTNYIDIPKVYPAGRLDYDSEGLLLLTEDGRLQARISHPEAKLAKHYWVQVEGEANSAQLQSLRNGVKLRDGRAVARHVSTIEEPECLWPRDPPIRERKHIPTSWLELVISEGRNRQVRRMTAAVGLPALRLIRHRIGPWSLEGLNPGDSAQIETSAAWKLLNA